MTDGMFLGSLPSNSQTTSFSRYIAHYDIFMSTSNSICYMSCSSNTKRCTAALVNESNSGIKAFWPTQNPTAKSYSKRLKALEYVKPPTNVY